MKDEILSIETDIIYFIVPLDIMVSDTIPNITRHLLKSADEIPCTFQGQIAELILGLRLANERRRYFVTTSLIGWTQTWNQPVLYVRATAAG